MKLNHFLNIKGDMVVWMIFIFLCSISILEVYSASSSMTYKSGVFWRPIMQHGCYVLMGMGVAWIVHLIPCRFFKLFCLLSLILSFFLLLYVLAAVKINDAARWIQLGSITVQPSELAKISLVGFIAFIASSARENGHISWSGIKLILGASAITIGLIMSENISTAALITLVVFFMLCICKAPNKLIGWIVGLGAAALVSAGLLLTSLTDSQLDWMRDKPVVHRVPMAMNRIKGHERPVDPKDYNLTENVQVTHARIAIATCNVVGKGPGNSIQRDYLPQAFSDFIFAIIIEEWGVFGAIFVMFLYLLLMYRAMRIAGRCGSLFPAYLVMGLALMMVMQAMMNMAVAVGAMPVTGQPLPLISKGGTSTFINCAYIGMILSVSWTAKAKTTETVTVAAIEN